MKTRSRMYKALTLTCCSTLLILSHAATASDQKRIKQARSAAPPSVSAEATIVDGDKVLVEGNNGWTCMPDTFPGDNAPICVDSVWMKMMQAMGKKEEFTADKIGISYMLQGDQGSGVSNSNPHHHDHMNAEDYVETGPHLMIIVPKEMLAGITDDPSEGGPYVMWGETPYAHIMIPVEDLKASK
ncbi:hypothetical protein [Kangiella sp.]|uniref:hypothetical protein n=1 Tax=Kangiella sp. TaxID=1920245 RepID=UPI003A92F32E